MFTLMERLDLQIFFNVITVVIDTLLNALWHFSYTLVIELSCHVVNRTLTDFRDPFAQLATVTRWSPSISCSCSTFAIVSAQTEGWPEHCSSWMSLSPYMNSLTHFCTFWTHCGPQTLHNWRWMSMGVVLLALKKWISEGELHRERLSNQDWTSQQAWFCGYLKGWGSQTIRQRSWILHKAFLTAPVPWRPYFTDMLRVSREIFYCKSASHLMWASAVLWSYIELQWERVNTLEFVNKAGRFAVNMDGIGIGEVDAGADDLSCQPRL